MTSSASIILPPLSTVYAAIARARLAAYRRGWLSVAKLAAPVISVGNLTTGGTGKTPMVEWVCRVLAGQEQSKKVCVLTRGYGRTNPKSQVVVSNGTEILADERMSGDEPFLLARNLLGIAAVIANPNRVAAGEWALQNLGSEAFVLDDGFQHLHLARNLDIVTIDATNPFGGSRLLPAGRLREPISSLARADCVVITRSEQVEDLAALTDVIQGVAGPAPIFKSSMATARIRELGSKEANLDKPSPQPLGAFCGVGNPESFFNHLRREGYELAFGRAFADHHRYEQSDVDQLVEQARSSGASALITTAKDETKLAELKLNVPCYVLDIEISIDDDERLVKLIRHTGASPQK